MREVDKDHVVILRGARWDSNFKVLGQPFDSNVMYTFHKYWTPPTRDVITDCLAYRDRYTVTLWMGDFGENTDDWIAKFVRVLRTNAWAGASGRIKRWTSPAASSHSSDPRTGMRLSGSPDGAWDGRGGEANRRAAHPRALARGFG
jgi:hypothetical protein